jgi:hypothetical protein
MEMKLKDLENIRKTAELKMNCEKRGMNLEFSKTSR